MSVRPIQAIIRDAARTHESRALECLVALDELAGSGQDREAYRAGAVTFALLALADLIGHTQTGVGLAEVVRRLVD